MKTIKDMNNPHFKVTIQYIHEPIKSEDKTFSGPQNRPAEKIFEQRLDEIDLPAIVMLLNKRSGE